ncbi:hypothetical protein A3F37_01000 [Candidatus Saccharibacteria bacterium RIFCSPHIGHO2_12_FULL_41_12]|nr:MAG: hypothetical protein A3F37_01000 [Candidatus Saccharibacteria bacterium RIFCSPHIGHO2_12_FULL_41_12]
MITKRHRDRVIKELKQAGVTRYGLFRSESKYLPQLLHENEHIGGVIYGRVGIDFTMLVATDKRVLYFQSKPLYSETDEVTYDVVSGVKNSYAVLFSSITLHTRVKDYTINFVNVRCARKFVKYIESRRIKRDNSMNSQPSQPTPQISIFHNNTNTAGLKFLKEHEVAVLSTTDKKGMVSGAIMYYLVANNLIYIITRSETTKAHNIFGHGQVALTVYEPSSLKTAQVSGIAEVENDADTRKIIFDQMIKSKHYREGESFPPVTKFTDGSYVVIRITPKDIKYRDFSKK